MALAHIISQIFPNTPLHGYTVDHGLREGSGAEAQQVAEWLAPVAAPRVLRWLDSKPETGIQDAARNARYDLLHRACVQDNVSVLCVAHHRDDQAETVLHRLAKGSGLDGLGGIRAVSDLKEIKLLRPVLQESHEALVQYCRDNNIPWVEDPSNENDKFARVRLRQSREVLDAEGLTNERLSRLANRMSRARQALDFYTDDAMYNYVTIGGEKAIIAPDAGILPAEIYLRLILKTASAVNPDHTLSSRLERLESWLFDADGASKTTLGHIILDRLPDGTLRVSREIV